MSDGLPSTRQHVRRTCAGRRLFLFGAAGGAYALFLQAGALLLLLGGALHAVNNKIQGRTTVHDEEASMANVRESRDGRV